MSGEVAALAIFGWGLCLLMLVGTLLDTGPGDGVFRYYRLVHFRLWPYMTRRVTVVWSTPYVSCVEWEFHREWSFVRVLGLLVQVYESQY